MPRHRRAPIIGEATHIRRGAHDDSHNPSFTHLPPPHAPPTSCRLRRAPWPDSRSATAARHRRRGRGSVPRSRLRIPRGHVLRPDFAFLTGRAPTPPVARLTGRRIVAASYGSATCALPATSWLAGPKGPVHSGVPAVLADGALISNLEHAQRRERRSRHRREPRPARMSRQGHMLHLAARGLTSLRVGAKHVSWLRIGGGGRSAL
jgi:acyl-coenzyme A thioesterase PaaI-like protein